MNLQDLNDLKAKALAEAQAAEQRAADVQQRAAEQVCTAWPLLYCYDTNIKTRTRVCITKTADCGQSIFFVGAPSQLVLGHLF